MATSGMTQFLEQQILGSLRGVPFSRDALYIDLYTSPVSENGSGTKVADPTYSRQKCTLSGTSSDGSGSYVVNENTIVFPEASVNWGSITHFSVCDTAGAVLLFGQLMTPITVSIGDAITIDAGKLKIYMG